MDCNDPTSAAQACTPADGRLAGAAARFSEVAITHHALRRHVDAWAGRVEMRYQPETRRLQVLLRPVSERWTITLTPYNALRWARRYRVFLEVI